MKEMRISISFATIRYGWLENTFRCLGQQTFPHDEWELIMIDDLPEDRSEYVLRLAKKENINVKWMRSKPNYWKSNRMLGNARNTGFVHSDGELVVFLDDYTWIPPTFLQRHWEIYKDTNMAVIGRVQAVRYKGDIKSTSDIDIIGDDHRCKYVIEKGLSNLPDAFYSWFYTFNTSAPLENLIKINGYDEEFDCTGEDDMDLAERLTRVDTRFIYTIELGITAFHMQHGEKTDLKCRNCGKIFDSEDNWYTWGLFVCPNCKKEIYMADIIRLVNMSKRFKDNDVHNVTKELYNTQYDGSWGLFERNKRKNPWEVNKEYFNLSGARNNLDKYHYKIYEIKG